MSSLVLWPHFYRKEKWLFQNLLRPISTEACGEHLCLQKLLLDKSSRPSPSPHQPSELLQLGHPGLKNTFNTDVFYWFVLLEWWRLLWNKHLNNPCWVQVQELQTGCAGLIRVPGLGDHLNYDSAEKSPWIHEGEKLCKVKLWSYADEVQVEEKRVFMQNDGGCMKNEGRRNNINPHVQY